MEKENNMRMKECLEWVKNHNKNMKANLKMANGMKKEKNIESVWQVEVWNMTENLLMVNLLDN